MAKSESIILGLTATASAADAPVQKKIFKSVWKTNILIFSNKEKEIIEVKKYLKIQIVKKIFHVGLSPS